MPTSRIRSRTRNTAASAHSRATTPRARPPEPTGPQLPSSSPSTTLVPLPTHTPSLSRCLLSFAPPLSSCLLAIDAEEPRGRGGGIGVDPSRGVVGDLGWVVIAPALAAAVFAVDRGAARRAAGCAGGAETPLDLGGGGARGAVGAGCGKRSVYLMESVPLWGCAATRGRGAEMEDACAAVPRFSDVPVRMLAGRRELNGLDFDFDATALRLTAHLFGVYDGHGGSEVANYCQDRIHVVLREILRTETGLRDLGEVDVKEKWEKAFGACFQRIDDEVSGKASRHMLNNGVEGFRFEPVAANNVGSTAVVAVVCSSHVITANCGDSRVVLCRGKEPIALSIDHKPDRKDERERIEAAGGKVIDWNGYRVSGILAMSRSIGDRYLKPFLIPRPEITVVPRAKDDDCLILASDGLWDVMSNEEACKVARLQILMWYKNNDAPHPGEEGEPTMNPAAQAAADCLVRIALTKGSEDNITVIVVDLKLRKKLKGKS